MLLLPILAFICVSLLVTAAALAISPQAVTIEQRLDEIAGVHNKAAEPSPFAKTMVSALMRIGRAAPKSASEMGKLRAKLVCAGYRAEEALILFVGIRLGCALLMFGIASVLFRAGVLVALGSAGLGYLLPSMILGRMAKRRQHRIRLSLPDALDLMVVSVEAGLGLDQAMQRVADELIAVHRELSEELRLVNLELVVQLEAADLREVVALGVEEQVGRRSTISRRSSRCWCRPTSSAPAWRRRCASIPTRHARSVVSGQKRRQPRPERRWCSRSSSASSPQSGS